MGGSVLSLAHRVAALSTYMDGVLSASADAPKEELPLTEEVVLSELQRCYFDSALSGGTALASARSMGVLGHVVWGSDFPAVPQRTISWFDEQQASELSVRERIDVKSRMVDVLSSRGVVL